MARILEGDFLEMKKKKKSQTYFTVKLQVIYNYLLWKQQQQQKNLCVWNFVVMHTAIEHEVDVC